MKKPLIGLNPYYFEYSDAMWNELDFSNFVVYTSQAMISRTFSFQEDIK